MRVGRPAAAKAVASFEVNWEHRQLPPYCRRHHLLIFEILTARAHYGADKFRQSEETWYCRPRCTRDLVKTQVTFRRQRQRLRFRSAPRGLTGSGNHRPRNRMVVWGTGHTNRAKDAKTLGVKRSVDLVTRNVKLRVTRPTLRSIKQMGKACEEVSGQCILDPPAMAAAPPIHSNLVVSERTHEEEQS